MVAAAVVVAAAHAQIQVYQDGARVGASKTNTINCVGTASCSVAGSAVRVWADAGTSLPTPPVCEGIGWDGGAFTCGNYDGGSSEGWHNVGAAGEPAFESSWVNYDTSAYYAAGFRKVAGNRVELRGLIKSGTVSAGCTQFIFTIPASYRPNKHTFAVSTSNGGALVTLSARSGGGICATTGSNVWLALDNISWSLDP